MVHAGDINVPDDGEKEETIEEAKRKSLALYEKSFETSPLNFEKGHKNSVQFEEPIVKPIPTKDTNAKVVEAPAEKPNFFRTFSRILALARPEWC
ncbi:hypothetical protein KR018_004124, partial [Drosophila ironensis]